MHEKRWLDGLKGRDYSEDLGGSVILKFILSK
jgi:hypothetical protein